MTLDEYINFLDKSKKILEYIINYYYNQPRSSNQPQAQSQAGVASAAVPVVVLEKNQYFYDYNILLDLVSKSIEK